MRPAGAPGAPPQQAYARAFGDVAAHVALDEAYAKTAAAVQTHLGLLQKQAQVRVRNWLKKLSEEVRFQLQLVGLAYLQTLQCSSRLDPAHTTNLGLSQSISAALLSPACPQTANVVWKRNRNAYARLLVEQLRCGKLVEPFTGQPPGGPLPTLPKHLAYAFRPPRSSPAAAAGAAPSTGRSPGAGQAASVLQGAQAATQQALSQRQALSQGVQQQSLLSASEQLDAYLGRADFRRAEAAEEEAAVASAFVPREAVVNGSLRAAGGGARGARAAPQLLPGTRMQLRGAEGQHVDR